MADEEPKIIIDEGWKAQVQREKEEALAKAEDEPEQPEAEDAEEEGLEAENSFAALVQSLAAQCMLALGLIAPPDAKEVMLDIAQAKYVIDILLMLRDKTKGNLTPGEDRMLTDVIADLQRAYVARAQQAQEAALKQSGINPADLKDPQL